MPSSSTAVAVHATGAGVATTNASQKVATNIVPCTHHRSGTLSRSWWLGGWSFSDTGTANHPGSIGRR